MATDLSRGPSDAMPARFAEIALNIQLVPESTLKEIAKGPLVQFALTCAEKEKVDRVWQSLLKTVSSPGLSHQHTAAACNAVSAFIDAAVNSENPATKQLSRSSTPWLALFDVFMARYEDVKPKPLKQLLGSLATILAKYHEQPTKELAQAVVMKEILPTIILGEPRSRLKGSLVCLELFIRKSAILPRNLISLARKWLAENRLRWIPVFERDRQVLYPGIPCPDAAIMHDHPSEELAARVFFLGLLGQTSNRAMAGTSGLVMATFLSKLKSQSPDTLLSSLWVSSVRHILLKNLELLDFLSVQILPPLFKADPSGFIAFMESLPLKSLTMGDMTGAEQSEYMLLFVSLEVGKKANLVHEDYDSSKDGKTTDCGSHKILLKSEVIGNFLLHRDPHIRVAALSLLITAFSTIKPLTTAATNAILRGLPSMHADSDSYSRGEIMSLTRRLIVRLKGGVLVDQNCQNETKLATGIQPTPSIRDEATMKAFLRSYIDFLQRDLCVTASYPRHISALKALNLLLISGLDPRADVIPVKSEVEVRWKLHMEVLDLRLLRLLVDLLVDPFEEVRQTALSITNMFPRSLVPSGFGEGDQHVALGLQLTGALARAESLASKTSRADHADTVARLYHIIFCAALPHHSPKATSDWWATKSSVVNDILTKLEERLSSPKGLFNTNMREAPLHGYMSGLRYIVLTPNFYSYISAESEFVIWRSFHNRIVAICDQVWQEVKPVLCIDSPEGHSDEPTEDLSVGPKDVLSYSWRALRESSLLLHGTVFNVTYGPSGGNGLLNADFEKIGKTSFTQLADLRHRGAFSTVSQTFTTCCQRCSDSKDPALQELPRRWYREAITTIFHSASKLTRRSAGLPAMITAILSSSPGTPFFKHSINELHDISRLSVEYDQKKQYLELPQVHSMNCLKDIFTNTKLGPYTEAFIMSALTLSAERLGSPIWALRNSGLMLFRALLTRMCRLLPGVGAGFGGVSGAEPGSKISFPKYPGLLDLLSELLAPTNEVAAHEGTEIITERIFPALELVGEKIPTFDDNQDCMLRKLVLGHLKSPVWGIREHAARVYASLLTRTGIPNDVHDLVSHLKEESGENYIHGIALCVRYSLRRFAATPDVFWTSHIDDVLAAITHALVEFFAMARSPYVVNTLIEILSDCLERSIKANVEERVTPIIDDIAKQLDLDGILHNVFDGSAPGWNLTSSTRASSLMRRAVAWCTILRMFVRQQWDGIPDFYHAVSQFDTDAGIWLSEQLQENLSENDKYTIPLVRLFSSAIVSNLAGGVKATATCNLASILEGLLSKQQTDVVSTAALPVEGLTKSLRPDSQIQIWNRSATNAALRLQGCLLAIQVSGIGQRPLSLFSSDIQSWAVKLRSALEEETEFTTRYAAVSSLQSFARSLRPNRCSPRVDPLLLELYLALYDMLNDDDEEVRDIAASTASWVLSCSSVSPNAAVALGPLNASALLSRFISEHYSDSVYFTRRLVKYLTGQENRLSGSYNRTALVPVSHLVDQYSQESTVLFVEEKQNLFIDEVREVDVWSQAILRLKKDALPEKDVREMADWVFQGLQHISSYISNDSGKDGLLGWISKPDSFTLAVRIISITAVLISDDFAAPESMRVEKSALRYQLEAFLKAGRNAAVHDELLFRIESGLGGNVPKASQL